MTYPTDIEVDREDFDKKTNPFTESTESVVYDDESGFRMIGSGAIGFVLGAILVNAVWLLTLFI